MGRLVHYQQRYLCRKVGGQTPSADIDADVDTHVRHPEAPRFVPRS